MISKWTEEYRKQYYKDRYQANKKGVQERARNRRHALMEWLRDLKDAPCSDCGTTYHFSAMQFDHLRDKNYDVSSMVSLGFGKKAIQKEVDKCELVCANCHAARTYRRNNRD